MSQVLDANNEEWSNYCYQENEVNKEAEVVEGIRVMESFMKVYCKDSIVKKTNEMNLDSKPVEDLYDLLVCVRNCLSHIEG